MLTLFIAVVYSFSHGSIYCVLNRQRRGSQTFQSMTREMKYKIPMEKAALN